MKRQIAGTAAILACLLSTGMAGCSGRGSDSSAPADAPGSYSVTASMSCYIPAMGGVEFGATLLTDTEYTVSEDGSAELTLHLTKSSVTIYSITCYTFVDATPDTGAEPTEGEAADGTIGYYDDDLGLVTEGVEYTLSDDTTPNPAGEEVHYVDSITFPVAEKKETYYLTFYINSTVMGAQFKVTADGGTARAATLTVDWSALQTREAAE